MNNIIHAITSLDDNTDIYMEAVSGRVLYAGSPKWKVTDLKALVAELAELRGLIQKATVIHLGRDNQFKLAKGAKNWRAYKRGQYGDGTETWAAQTDAHSTALDAFREMKGKK